MDQDQALKWLGVISAVIGIPVGIGSIIGFLGSHNLIGSIEEAVPIVGWTTLAMLVIAGVGIAIAALFTRDEGMRKPEFEVVWVGLFMTGAPIASIAVWGIEPLGWFGFLYLGSALLSMPDFAKKRREMRKMGSCSACKAATPAGAKFCPMCGESLAYEQPVAGAAHA